jgi:hypothetical protein
MTEQALKSIIIDHHGNHWGPFESGVDAAKFAAAKWPEQESGGRQRSGRLEARGTLAA